MSLLFMLFALLGALLVLGGGSYALQRVVAYRNERFAVEEEPPAPQPRVEPEPQVGGYVPAPRVPGELPPSLHTRVHDLVVLGRTEDAVRMVRDRVDGDEARARRIVAEFGGEESGRALEP